MSTDNPPTNTYTTDMPEPVDARLLGELAIVVIRAQHLSDRSKIGKHHPYVALKYGNNKAKTPVVKKGGQHPTFDAEVRFKITEDAEDIMTRGSDTGDTNSSGSKKGRRIPKNKNMVVSVFADDPKDPKLVGETVVDLTTVFEKCEHDDMFELKYKNMFAGEIYLEMTYFINDAPPIPKKVPKPMSWMDYGATGPLPPGQTRHSSLESRLPQVPGQPTPFPAQGVHDPHRRDSYSGAASMAYIPPPTFPGRHSRGSHAALPPAHSGPASAGPSVPNPPYQGFPSSTEGYPEPHQSHAHRHSLNGAIPQHGSWQSDQAYYQPPANVAYGSAPAPPPSNFETQPIASYPSHPYHTLPNAASRNQNASSVYPTTGPPAAAFPNLSDMAMALPPLPPPPVLELPGRTTPLPPSYGVPATGLRPSTTPIPESYQYALPPQTQVNPYPPPSAPPVVHQPPNYAHAPPYAGTMPNATYPLYENRPSSSMGALPPPDRPYSSASTHYPSTVTSSFHVSSANVTSGVHGAGSGWAQPPTAQYGASSGYADHATVSRNQYMQPPNENAPGPRYDQRDPLYAETSGYGNPVAYPPPPRPLSAATSTWTTQEPETKPGRSYLQSLGVGSSPAVNPSRSDYSYQHVDQRHQVRDTNAPWQSAQTHDAYGHQSYESSGPVPPSGGPSQMYQQPSRVYDQPQYPAFSGY